MVVHSLHRCVCSSQSSGFFWLWVFGLFFTPLADEFGWSRSAASIGVTTYLLLSALVSPFIGRMGDRYGYLKLIFSMHNF